MTNCSEAFIPAICCAAYCQRWIKEWEDENECGFRSRGVELAPQGSALENTATYAESRGRISVSLPEEYESNESIGIFVVADDAQIELPTTTVQFNDASFDLQIPVDDAGYVDWWCNGTVSKYVETAKVECLNSSWPISVDGCEGVVLVQGFADAGGEISGDAFVFHGDATIYLAQCRKSLGFAVV